MGVACMHADFMMHVPCRACIHAAHMSHVQHVCIGACPCTMHTSTLRWQPSSMCKHVRACAGSIVVGTPGLFTNSAAVSAAMLGLVPLFCAVLIIHTTSMTTEGIMLAGKIMIPPILPNSMFMRDSMSCILLHVVCIAACLHADLDSAEGRLKMQGMFAWMPNAFLRH